MTPEPATASALSRLAELNARVDAGELSEAEFEKEMEALEGHKERRRENPTAPRLRPKRAQKEGVVLARMNHPKKRKYRALPRDEVYQVGMQIQNPEVRAIYFTAYIAAARVSEVLPLMGEDVVNKPATDKRAAALVLRLITLKRKDNLQRSPSILKQPPYLPMIAEVEKWRDQFKPTDALFKIQRTNVNRYMKKVKVLLTPEDDPSMKEEVALHPHLLRHWRLSHLRLHHRFDLDELKAFTGRRTYPFEYIHIEEEHLAERQMENQS